MGSYTLQLKWNANHPTHYQLGSIEEWVSFAAQEHSIAQEHPIAEGIIHWKLYTTGP